MLSGTFEINPNLCGWDFTFFEYGGDSRTGIRNSVEKDINNLNLTSDFFKAKENNDELAVQAALFRVSTFLSGINGVLEQAREDVDRFIKIPDVTEFPDNYKIPEHYHYPIK